LAALERRTARGILRVVAADSDLLEPAAEIALELGEHPGAQHAAIELAGRSARWRKSSFRGASRFGAACRSLFPSLWMRCLREQANLVWLRERLFQAPSPLAAGFMTRAGLPCFEFSLIEAIADAETLDAFLRGVPFSSDGAEGRAPSVGAQERARVLTELARELARMHALRFVHGELSPDRVIVGPRSDLARVYWPPSANGGPRLSTRGTVSEAASFTARCSAIASEPELRAFTAAYIDERMAQGRPVDARRLSSAIAEVQRARH
jgi:hypothetical protein